MEAHYQVIANALVASCKPNFESATLDADVQSDHSKISYSCNFPGRTESVTPGMRVGSQVDDALHELRAEMKHSGRHPWSRCKFTLFPDGNFTFDVEYDD